MNERAETEPIFYRQGDGDRHALDGQTICIVGFGHLGASMARNLRDAGLTVTIGNIDDDYRAAAKADGFVVGDIREQVAAADLVYVLIADEVIPGAFRESIAPALRAGLPSASPPATASPTASSTRRTRSTCSCWPPACSATRCGALVDGKGYASYVSVEHDASGQALQRLLALADAVGALQVGALQLTATQEATLDLFIEQTVGPYLGTAIQLAFELGTAAGLPAEAMVLELYQSGEMSRTFESFANVGFYRSVTAHGVTAQYGGFLRTLELDHEQLRNHFVAVLDDIRAGGFAAKLQQEGEAGYPTMRSIEGITAGTDPMSLAEDRVRRALGRHAS